MSNFMESISQRIKLMMENSRFFSRNTGPKVVSIIFALVMWLYVMGEVNPESVIELANVNVQLLNVENLEQSGLVIIGQKDFTANVKVTGRRNELYKVTPQDIIVRADLRGFHKGVNSIPLEISAPANISFEDVSPKQIKVTLDELIKRQKPVKVHVVGSSAEGFEPGEASVSPSEVIVEGPESLVNAVDAVLVDVDVKKRSGDIEDQLPIKAVNSQGKEVNGVEIKNKYVMVTLPMHAIKEVPISIELDGKPKENFKIIDITLDSQRVIIKGPKEILDGIHEIKTENVNIDGLEKTTQRPITLILPEGVEAPYLDINLKATIDIEEIKMKEFSYKKDEIDIQNLENEFTADVNKLPDIIKVQVEAVESLIDIIDKGDIHLYINGEGMGEGKYSVNIQYNTSQKVEKITVIPRKVDFEIESKKNIQTSTTNP